MLKRLPLSANPIPQKQRERVCGKRFKRVVGTVENELCAAGYRAELADDEPVIVYRIMIKHIVFLKIARVVHKVIVNSEISDFDGRTGDNRFQIYRLIIIKTWIYFILLHNPL